MTTIAWDGEIIAADCRCSWGNSYKDTDVKLVKRNIDGKDVIFGGVGCKALFEAMIGWYIAGTHAPSVPLITDQDCGLLVFKDNVCHMYKSSVPYYEEFIAPESWGSGGQYAMGAMLYGANAVEAVEIAAQCDNQSSAANITTFKFNDRAVQDSALK